MLAHLHDPGVLVTWSDRRSVLVQPVKVSWFVRLWASFAALYLFKTMAHASTRARRTPLGPGSYMTHCQHRLIGMHRCCIHLQDPCSREFVRAGATAGMASMMDVDANDSGEAASGCKEHTAAAAEGAYSGLLDALRKTPKQLPCRCPRDTPDHIPT